MRFKASKILPTGASSSPGRVPRPRPRAPPGNLGHHDLILILDRIPDFLRIISLGERANRTVGDTLTAESTVSFRIVLCPPHSRSFWSRFLPHPRFPVLNLVADLHAAHALDALRGIADQREVLVPRLVFGSV